MEHRQGSHEGLSDSEFRLLSPPPLPSTLENGWAGSPVGEVAHWVLRFLPAD